MSLPIGRCKCGAITTATLALHGLLEARRHVCGPCVTEALGELEHLRQWFKLLVDNGVSRERANAIMIRRIEAGR